MVPEEVTEFCADKRSVCIVEEGFPDYLEQALNATLRKADLNTTVVGKDVFPKAGEYQSEVMMNGLAKFIEGAVPKGIDLAPIAAVTKAVAGQQGLRRGTARRTDPETPAGILHRLSGAAGVLRPEAGPAGSGNRQDAYLRRYRLPYVLYPASLQPWGIPSPATGWGSPVRPA